LRFTVVMMERGFSGAPACVVVLGGILSVAHGLVWSAAWPER